MGDLEGLWPLASPLLWKAWIWPHLPRSLSGALGAKPSSPPGEYFKFPSYNTPRARAGGVAKVGAEKRALTRRIKRTGSDKAGIAQRRGGILAEACPVTVVRITQPTQLIIAHDDMSIMNFASVRKCTHPHPLPL